MPKGSSKKTMSKKMTKQVESIVNKALSEELEEKRAIQQKDNVGIPATIASGDVTTVANFQSLLPPINQVLANTKTGTIVPGQEGAYGFRIGDEINLKSVKIKGYVSMKDVTTDDNRDCKIGVRVMILKQKDKESYAGFLGDAHTDKLLLDQVNTAGQQGPGLFDGSPLDLIKDINRNEFSVRYDRLFYLSRDVITGSGSTRVSVGTKNTLKFFEHELTFGNGKKLSFTDGASTTPNNFPYLMVVGAADLVDPLTTIPNGLVSVTYNSVAVYTDA